MRRLFAIGIVWAGCAVAWAILGGTLVERSGESSAQLDDEVRRLWGPAQRQQPPHASYPVRDREQETVTSQNPATGAPVKTIVEREVVRQVPVPLVASDIDVRLALRHRKKGLMWFPTYGIVFQGRFDFTNPGDIERRIDVQFPLGEANTIYDGLRVLDPAGAPMPVTIAGGTARFSDTFAPNERRSYTVDYRSRGTTSWHYGLTDGTGQVRALRLEMATDFAEVDFPPGTLSPTAHHRTAGGWTGRWSFENLVASTAIGVALPERINPGPLAARITFFAPVGLLFFVFVVAIFAATRERDIHPMNYFFFGCAFFAFHLLFAYLVDHVEVAPAFAIASAVSLALVVSYARLFVGWRFAFVQMGLSQLLYLVLFSFTFFWKGFTGLSITVGAILTLFVMMQLTGRVDWRARFARQGGG